MIYKNYVIDVVHEGNVFKAKIDGQFVATHLDREKCFNRAMEVVDNYYDILKRKFTFVAPIKEQIEKYEKLNAAALQLAYLIYQLTPDCDERYRAIVKLREAIDIVS